MFRFTIRDLLWLTLTVATGLGWLVQEQRRRVELDATKTSWDAACAKQIERAKAWRMRAGALEQVLTRNDFTVGWNLESSIVKVHWEPKTISAIGVYKSFYMPTDVYEPSIEE